jgi:hypothetical protein
MNVLAIKAPPVIVSPQVRERSWLDADWFAAIELNCIGRRVLFTPGGSVWAYG